MVSDWTARISRVTKKGTQIRLEMFTAEISDVETEEEVRDLLAEEFEDFSVDQVRRTPGVE